MNDFLLTIEKLAPHLIMACLRPLGIFFLMPVLVSKNIGGSLVRNALVILIVLPVFPAIDQQNVLAQERSADFSLFLGMAQEIMIGVLIGFVAGIPFWAIDSAGSLIDTVRGSSMGNIYNPSLSESSTLLGVFFSQLLTVVFFSCGGINALMTALYQSYVLFPPGGHIVLNHSLLVFLKQQWDLLFTLFLKFSLPAVGIMLLTDIAMGLLNRTAQQLNVFFLAMSIKSVLALLVLMITLVFSLSDLGKTINTNLSSFTSLWAKIQ
ncbi:type III secretion system export apparatus subunit SctT [unidentified bacterial endosymbiont]|uniref:type III secretion system export apparatus subunit SctT n=1 Tax=unidentified bacterial endosymbiont TaxID=2355 RepID=UPI00209F3E3B|nr:type III secretion system export apparatus subunit SctT [unidentified bacterial endosymbiont]